MMPAYLVGTFEQPKELGPTDDVLAGTGVELAKQVLQVPLDGFFADRHGLGDFLVG